ncbi:MAG: hypothetical protein U5K33_10670 [Halofilum sp. (in: g-proteobacteria)]|nr:hypothetical protein [Halofilum sp. (in: g-proteobacteria)]
MVKSNEIQKPIRVGFLLTPGYSLIAFASAIDPLRMANRLTGKELYQWITYTVDGERVTASNGVEVTPDAALSESANLNTLFVCAGVDPENGCDRNTLSVAAQARPAAHELRRAVHRQPRARARRAARRLPLHHPLGEHRQHARGVPARGRVVRTVRDRP